MRYTYKDLVQLVPSNRRTEFTKIYEYLHKVESPQENDLLYKVSDHFKVAASDIKSPKKYADVAFARQVYMTTVKVCTTKTLAEVARLVHKDHATVCHALKTVKKDYEYNAVRRNKIRHFISKLDEAKQELLLDFFNERNPSILTTYSVDVDRVATPSQLEMENAHR
jgi:chromosomal replication initiation ATPase DnaA